MEIIEISQACLAFSQQLGKDFDLRKLTMELYDGPNDELSVANFIGTLHNKCKRQLDAKLKDWLMDSIPQSFTPEERLLLKIRVESAAGSLPTLTGAICHRAAPTLDVKAASEYEAIFWAVTSFWSLIYSSAIQRAARMLTCGYDTLLAPCPN